jgi:hypothetical protein
LEAGLAGAREVNWDIVALDYRYGHITKPAICRKHGITLGELNLRASTHKWVTDRTPDTDREILIGMMFGVIETQIGRLETSDVTAGNEKEVAVLGRLATTLEKLIDIEDKGRPVSGHGENMKDLRNKLARRIEQLKSR